MLSHLNMSGFIYHQVSKQFSLTFGSLCLVFSGFSRRSSGNSSHCHSVTHGDGVKKAYGEAKDGSICGFFSGKISPKPMAEA